MNIFISYAWLIHLSTGFLCESRLSVYKDIPVCITAFQKHPRLKELHILVSMTRDVQNVANSISQFGIFNSCHVGLQLTSY
jgi:hypothetical protein